ncbi:MAG TPA: DUF1801 domain-containing protein, partial [Aggregicoccus sp.]|nr:DUF1801 domain-containing protein [Aggregicoccus sp.]
MPNESEDVEQFLKALQHPLKPQLQSLRRAILACSADISEHIKWKAPSFCVAGDDRVTFRLHPKGHLQLVFHRGARVKDAKGFRFEDDSGLLEWAAADRGVLTLRDAQDVEAKQAAVVRLVQRWMAATA